MDVEAWQVMAGLAGLLIVYAIGVVFLEIPVSVLGFLSMAVFIGIGVVLGRLLSRLLS